MEFESRTKVIIDELKEKLNNLLERNDISKDKVKDEVDHAVDELKKVRDQVDHGFAKFREDNKDSFEKIESGVKSVADEVSGIFKDAYDKFKTK